jgi:hypothetical protein
LNKYLMFFIQIHNLLATLIHSAVQSIEMENVFTAAKPFVVFAKLLGVFPMSFDGPARKGLLKSHWSDWICALLWMLLMLSALLLLRRLKSSFYLLADSEISLEAWYIAGYLHISSLSIFIFIQVRNREKIVRFLNLLHDFDNKVKLLDELP